MRTRTRLPSARLSLRGHRAGDGALSSCRRCGIFATAYVLHRQNEVEGGCRSAHGAATPVVCRYTRWSPLGADPREMQSTSVVRSDCTAPHDLDFFDMEYVVWAGEWRERGDRESRSWGLDQEATLSVLAFLPRTLYLGLSTSGQCVPAIIAGAVESQPRLATI